MDAQGPVKRVMVEAVVIRADGTREDLGTVSDSDWSRFDPRRVAAAVRIKAANRKAEREA